MGEARRRKETGATVRRVKPGELPELISGMVDGDTPDREDFQEELGLLLQMHFPDMKGVSEDEDLSCEQCIDAKVGVCQGRGLRGESVILECFSEKVGTEIFIEGR